jgi:predicted Zn-dependent protease
LGVLSAAMLGGCASQRSQQPISWDANAIVGNVSATVNLTDERGEVERVVPSFLIRRYVEVGTKVMDAAGVTVDIRIFNDDSVNAVAGYDDNGRPFVAMFFGFIDKVQLTSDEVAALMGHEMAHFPLEHHQAKMTRGVLRQLTSTTAGIALGIAGIPMGGIATDLALQTITSTFDRGQERDADRLGVSYAIAAGYKAEGAVTLQEKLADASTSKPIPFLSTHPSGAERIANLKELTGGIR